MEPRPLRCNTSTGAQKGNNITVKPAFVLLIYGFLTTLCSSNGKITGEQWTRKDAVVACF
jgi:hypothetical protein